jgi:PQQ-dependent catabolism-associated CXXCW motif protein
MVEDVQRPDGEQLRSLRPPFGLPAAAFCVATALLLLPASAEEPSAVAPGHVPEPQGLYQGAMHGYTPNAVTGAKVVDTAGLAKLIEGEHPLMLDVAEKDRKPPRMAPQMVWAPTHRSIPGAVFLQGAGRGTDDRSYAEAFKSRVSELTGGDRGKAVVTFCHPDCWGSYNAAKRLVALGYTRVIWYREGVEGWQAEHDTREVKPDPTWIAALPKELTQ